MEWIEVLSQSEEEKALLKGIDKFTLYDHNFTASIGPEGRTFRCLLNCKRINRVYHSLSQIEGDFESGKVGIRCWLLDQERPVHGQWQYQKIELTRFAFRYNQRSYKNIFIKTDPRSGEVAVALSYLTEASILASDRFKETMSDLCHHVGEESQMIFNTMLQIIFGRQANDPYLKSAIKVSPGFPRYMKIQKLLDKIKSLIATSNFYQIRSDISSAHKNRSYFKKVYLNTQKKLITGFKTVQMALLYEPKFSRKHQENEDIRKDDNAKKGPLKDRNTSYFIKDYIELEEKNEIQFAKHLNEGSEKQFKTPATDTTPMNSIIYDEIKSLFQLTYGDRKVRARGRQMTPEEYNHQILMLNLMGRRHPNMMAHLAPSNVPGQLRNWLFCLYQQQQPLVQFLRRNSRTMSLSTKLHIMAQICSFLQFLHRLCIGYFIQLQNIFITRGLQIRICGFKRCYRVNIWIQDKKEEDKTFVEHLMLNENQMIEFPYRFLRTGELWSQKCDVMSLGVCLYRVLMDKFPFFEKIEGKQWSKEEWLKMWTVETEYFLVKGGELVKIIGHLLLKCMELDDIANRPYVEWLLVILCQIRTSRNGLY